MFINIIKKNNDDAIYEPNFYTVDNSGYAATYAFNKKIRSDLFSKSKTFEVLKIYVGVNYQETLIFKMISGMIFTQQYTPVLYIKLKNKEDGLAADNIIIHANPKFHGVKKILSMIKLNSDFPLKVVYGYIDKKDFIDNTEVFNYERFILEQIEDVIHKSEWENIPKDIKESLGMNQPVQLEMEVVNEI